MSTKSRILLVQSYLLAQTDEQHPTTIADILCYLEENGISANRHIVIDDINILQEPAWI